MFSSAGARRASLPTTAEVKTQEERKRECRTFEPQQWRRSVCKNCFRTEPEHNAVTESSSVQQPVVTSAAPDKAWPGTPAISRRSVASSGDNSLVVAMDTTNAQVRAGNGGRRGLGVNSQRSGDDLQRGPPPPGCHRATPAPVQAPAPSQLPPTDRVSSSASQVAATGVFSSASSIDARYVEELENDFFDLEDKYDALARERNELSHELELKMRSAEELQNSLEQYKEKAVTLERRCAHLEEEVQSYRERLRLPESDRDGVGTDLKAVALSSALEGGEGSDDLRTRLNQVEQLCQDVMEENEVLKEEIEEMQREIEEMHDHFQEEDRDTMREMQRDLEAANKTCRILQFKLRKAERRFEQVDTERANLEERLTRLESEMYSEADVAHIRTLEEELRVSKEVTSRLNNELDISEEKRQFYEGQNHQLKDELQICQNRRITSENEVDRLRLELDKVKCESRFAERGPLQVTDKKAGRQSTTAAVATQPTPGSADQTELIRALQTTKEREADLSEQLRFAEEELRKMNRRVAEAQADNTTLSRQIERMTMQQVRGESPRATVSQVKKELAIPEEMTESKPMFSRPPEDRNAATAEKLKDALEDLQGQRDANRVTTKRVNQLALDLLMLKTNYKDPDWAAKYNEAVEMQKEAEQKVNALRRKLADAQSDIPNAVAVRLETRRPSVKSSESRAAMSKDWLLQKLDDYDKEMIDLEAEIVDLRSTAGSLRAQASRAAEEYADLKADADQRDRELRLFVEQLEKKDFLMNGILELMVQRTNLLQQELDRVQPKETEKKSSESNTEERFRNLEGLLQAERERSRVLESQLNAGGSDSFPRPTLSENERGRIREINALKTLLEEKDEQLEDCESQIRELKSRVERAKKMNEAMKTLIEEPPAPQSSPQTSRNLSTTSSLETKQTAIEISGYRREIDSMRKEIAILQQKVTQIEKVREKLLIENKDLQEELKLREDSLFDQDDELEKRNADLNKAKRALELMQVELNETRKELANARSQEGLSMKITSMLTENERLKTVVRSLEDEIKVTTESLKRAKSAEDEANEKCKRLTEVIESKETSLTAKEEMLTEAKNSAQTLQEELATARKTSSEAHEKVKKLEAVVMDLQKKLQERDSAATNREVIGRRPEIERLRRECLALRQERDEISKEARKDRQLFEKRLLEACNTQTSLKDGAPILTGSSSVGGLENNIYARACAEKNLGKKVDLLNEHILKQTILISRLKIENEVVQNKFLDYQRRYANLKEQYEAEQEAWLSERVVLESKAKEQEDRKITIAASRKSLQETSVQLAEAEANFEKQRQRLEGEITRLENEKAEIKINLTQLKEQQKLPKVLQRFNASPARAGHISSLNAVSSTSAANAETARRLDIAERTVARLKSELAARLEAQSQATVMAIHEAEAARAAAEAQMDSLNDQLIQLNLFREQAELFRERLVDSEQVADREYKIWSEEREDLLCRIEDLRITVDQWCLRLANRTDIEGVPAEEVVNDIVAEMERWRTSRQYTPVYQRRPCSEDRDIVRSHTSDTQSMMGESMLGTPAQQQRGYGPLSASHRATSVEWFSRSGAGGASTLRGSTLSLAGGVSLSLARSVTPSLSRCGRSVSPDVSIKKVTNYPDPTPGFLVRSRQTSIESLGSMCDLNHKPFTMPGKPQIRQPISPARRKFFDENSSFESGGGSFPKTDVVVLPPLPKTTSVASPGVTLPSNKPAEPVPPPTTTTKPVEAAVEKKSTRGGGRSTPSVLARISSKLTGSKTDLRSAGSSNRKTPPKEKRRSPSSSSSKQQRSKSPSSKPTPSKKSPPPRKSPEAETKKQQQPQQQRRGSDLVQSLASKLQSTGGKTTTNTTTTSRSVRAGSMGGGGSSASSSGIAPSIMALRQKFGGK